VYCEITLCIGLVITLVAGKPLAFMLRLFVSGQVALLSERLITLITFMSVSFR